MILTQVNTVINIGRRGGGWGREISYTLYAKYARCGFVALFLQFM
jgi:hypothetical protein